MGRTYYISPKGNDNNTGLSIHDAWKTIEKVNQVHFQPGDTILFESGGIWYGNLSPLGSGEQGKPITISSFGSGPMPTINIGKAAGTGIKLVDQSWWEIRGIEITSGAPPQLGVKREAISIMAKEGEVRGITIKDCYIHDIWGQLGGPAQSFMIYVGPANRRDRSAINRVNNILVENNKIERCDKAGIVVIGRNNIIVRRNYLENLGGDGIIVGGAYRGLIEYNVVDRTCLRIGDPDVTGSEKWWPHSAAVWIIWCEETIMQFNEVYNTGRQPRNGDGFAYDFDLGCRRCILQYNFSADNHGFLLIMNDTYGNIARYNISQNDQTHLIQMHGNVEDENLVHNNVFYVDHSTVDIDLYMGMEEMKDEDKAKLGAIFKNNIFYATGQGRFRIVYTYGEAWDRKFITKRLPSNLGGPIFRRNLYFGPWLNGLPDDPKRLVADPMFVAPGTGGRGLSTLDGYKLKPGSPCVDAGVSIEMDNRRDFYGNPINDGAIDIGVYEQPRFEKINRS